MTIPSDPTGPVPVPAVVRDIAAGRPCTEVWVNELGGPTFRIGDSTAGTSEFVKTCPTDLTEEARRLRWAASFISVPRVLGVGQRDGQGWLHTAGLPGESAVAPHWVARPRDAARAIGEGLRALHDRLPVADCPFDWSVAARLAELPADRRAGLVDPPPAERLVVCHGDACAPNTLIDDSGRCCGHVDLGELGVADRWADLAVATLSLGWNYPRPTTMQSRSTTMRRRRWAASLGAWEAELYDAYGVEPDKRRVDYYRRLWQAGDMTSG